MSDDNGCPMCEKPVMGRSALLSHLEFGHAIDDPVAYLAELEGPELTGRAARRAERRASKELARADKESARLEKEHERELERQRAEAERAAHAERAAAEAAKREAEQARADEAARAARGQSESTAEPGIVESQRADREATAPGAMPHAETGPAAPAVGGSAPTDRSGSEDLEPAAPVTAVPPVPRLDLPRVQAGPDVPGREPPTPPSPRPEPPKVEPARAEKPRPASTGRPDPMTADALSIFYPSDASVEPEEDLTEVVADVFARRRKLVLSVGAILVGLVVVVTAWSVGGGGGSRNDPEPTIPQFRAPFVIASSLEGCTRVGEQAEYTVTVEFSGARDITFDGKSFPGREGEGPHTFVHTAPAGINGYLDELVVTDPDGIDHFVEMVPPLYLPGC